MRQNRRVGRDLYSLLLRAGVALELAALFCLAGMGLISEKNAGKQDVKQTNAGGIWEVLEKHQQGELLETASGDYIKWVDFTVPSEAMNKAYEYDIDTWDEEIHLNWIELLAYAAARQGGDFGKAALKNIDECAAKLQEGESMEELTEKLKYYPYYLEAYTAVLDGFVGEYEMDGEKRYGLKAFSPIAADFPYTDYDDFGASRSYGYARPHLGHDMMGQIGTPIGILNGIYFLCSVPLLIPSKLHIMLIVQRQVISEGFLQVPIPRSICLYIKAIDSLPSLPHAVYDEMGEQCRPIITISGFQIPVPVTVVSRVKHRRIIQSAIYRRRCGILHGLCPARDAIPQVQVHIPDYSRNRRLAGKLPSFHDMLDNRFLSRRRHGGYVHFF